MVATPALLDLAGSGRSGEAVYRQGRLTASYLHLYFPSNPTAAAGLFGSGIIDAVSDDRTTP